MNPSFSGFNSIYRSYDDTSLPDGYFDAATKHNNINEFLNASIKNNVKLIDVYHSELDV